MKRLSLWLTLTELNELQSLLDASSRLLEVRNQITSILWIEDEELSFRARKVLSNYTNCQKESVKEAIESGHENASKWRNCGGKTIRELARWSGATKFVWRGRPINLKPK
jgi:hypothetical protein